MKKLESILVPQYCRCHRWRVSTIAGRNNADRCHTTYITLGLVIQDGKLVFTPSAQVNPIWWN